MDIGTQAEITLRQAGYETWTWTGGPVAVVCFEDKSVIGFIHIFNSALALLEKWQHAQDTALSRHVPALRAAGQKAWNVYSVFLTGGPCSPQLTRQIEQIEEDFSHTRKIARASIRTSADVSRALLPMLPVLSRPAIAGADYKARLRARLSDLPDGAVTAFLGPVEPAEVVRILAEAT